MDTQPLHNLIEDRRFDKYQDGLRSRFGAYKLNYELTYCEQSDNSAINLDFESETQIGRITAWVSGACYMEVLDKSSGQNVFLEHHQFESEEEFFEVYPRLTLFMLKDTWGF